MSKPTGTVTFLFTDIESSTKLWEQHPQAMREALARHDALLHLSIAACDGVVFKTVGDAFCAAFASPLQALQAALSAQQALQREPWPSSLSLRVRMALHTGVAEAQNGDYFGPPLNRVARLLATAHGGQTLLSRAVYDLTLDILPDPCALQDLGLHFLRDLGRPEQVFQLLHPDLPSEFPSLKSLDSFPNNLPRQVTSFVGREKELAQIKELLFKTRLLTLTGSGGAGKTRLSLQAAAEALDQYPDGVWSVELAPLADPDLVPQAVAGALGVKEQAGRTFTHILAEYMTAKTLLLVLDNCEHVLDAVAQLSDTLLRSCAGITILASSREGLGIAGETVYRVPSLSLPDRKQTATPENLSQYEAVRLFVERAEALLPAFAVTNANAPALASVCHRLDGIPLAIELAAARARSLSVEEINSRLDNRFRLLTGGSRTALPRQQTLRALIDWSYSLLTPQEKALLERLSVFAGGWTLTAAEAVCAGEEAEEWEVLDLLTSLVDKSLVNAEQADGQTRYRFLETVRQYARDRLVESEQSDAARRRHRDYFLALAEEARPQLCGREQARWLAVLEAEHDNLRQALTFGLEGADSEPDATEKGLRLGAALQPFWNTRGHLREANERLTALLAHPKAQAPTAARAAALNRLGMIVRVQSRYAEAQPILEESLQLSRQLGDRRGIAGCLHEMAVLRAIESDPAAVSLAEESLALWRVTGDKLGMAECLDALGWATERQHDFTRAQACFTESLAIRREMGDRGGTALSLHNLGDVALDQQDYAGARSLYAESLSLWRDFGDRWRVAVALAGLGDVAMLQGDDTAAWEIYQEYLAIHREFGSKDCIAGGLTALGDLAFRREDFALARSLYEESLAISQEIESWRLIGYGLLNLGNVALKTGEPGSARARYEESLTLCRKNDGRHSVACALEAFAALAVQEMQPARGARLWGAAEAWREEVGAPLPPQERIQYAPDIAAARQAIGEPEFAAAWAEGRAMTLEQAAAYALEAG